MSRREAIHRAQCAEPRCGEITFWTYANQSDRRDHLRRLAETPWRCTRHTQPDRVLSVENATREYVVTATRLLHLPDHLFWIADDEKSGSGFTFGPGFKAFAKDFPEGTRLVVTARIETPGTHPNTEEAT